MFIYHLHTLKTALFLQYSMPLGFVTQERLHVDDTHIVSVVMYIMSGRYVAPAEEK